MTWQIGVFFAILAAALVPAIKYRNWVWSNTDQLTKWLQIVALIVAGVWAYDHFSRVEAPYLDRYVSIENHIYPQPSPFSNTCLVNFKLLISNEGITSFEVNRVVITASSFNSQDLEENAKKLLADHLAAPFDPMAVAKPAGLKPLEIKSGFLIRPYPPKTRADGTFAWVFPMQATPSGYVFKAEVFGPNEVSLNTIQNSSGGCPALSPKGAIAAQ